MFKMKIVSALAVMMVLLFGGGCFVLRDAEPRFKKGTVLEIRRKQAKVLAVNGIGNDWRFSTMVSDTLPLYWSSKPLEVAGHSKVVIKSKATEKDPSYDDVGEGEIVITPRNLAKILKMKVLVDTVEVHEYHGPGAGNTAICYFEYEVIKKVENRKSGRSKGQLVRDPL